VTSSIDNLIGDKTLFLSVYGSVETSFVHFGLYIDQYLTWKNHIDYVLKRVEYTINQLNIISYI